VLLRDEWGAARSARGARQGAPEEVDLREVGAALGAIAEAESAGVEGDSGDEWVVGRAPVAGEEEEEEESVVLFHAEIAEQKAGAPPRPLPVL
jgi:hypothetical protein